MDSAHAADHAADLTPEQQQRDNDRAGRGLSRPLVLLLAFACGAAVANLYYAQPLLHEIAGALHTSGATAALVVTASQIGYAAGLMLIVPLGDLLDRRALVTRMLLVAAVGLAVAAAAPGLAVLAIAIAIVGVTSVVAQMLVPFASELASEEERGRVVGQVMSGLLIGILVARTFSGLVAGAAGWRAVFVVGAATMVLLAVALWLAMPDLAPTSEETYPRLLASVLALVRDEPGLRVRMVYGALGMSGFSILWTSLAFLLSRPPFDLGAAAIGLFGLAGLAGAGAAQIAGTAADRGGTPRATGAFLVAIVLGWALIELGAHAVLALIAGIVLLDLGVQGQHILNQTTIYALVPGARSRVTTAYMTGNFLCGALASAASAAAWSAWGWSGVCGLGGVLSLVGVTVWLLEQGSARWRYPLRQGST